MNLNEDVSNYYKLGLEKDRLFNVYTNKKT